MNLFKQQVAASTSYIREYTPHQPTIALVLGSGLGDLANLLPGRTTLITSEIPHYPVSTVEGHKGRLVFGMLGGKSVLAFQGRIHLYESNDAHTVLYPILVASNLGVQTLIITNAAGGINRQFSPGDLMIITDQLNLTSARVPDLPPINEEHRLLYDEVLIEKADEVARLQGIPLKRGVYAGVKGPSYETAAEVEMIYRIGADAVGMSTVMEASLASRLGIKVLGISCITNKATGIGDAKLSHQEVTEVANQVKKDFALLLSSMIASF